MPGPMDGTPETLSERDTERAAEDEVVRMLSERQLLREMDHLIDLFSDVGETVFSISWETSGGLGGGWETVTRVGVVYFHTPDPGIQEWTGPHEFFQDAVGGLIYIGSATREIWSDFPVEEWIHLAMFEGDFVDPESGEDRTISINGREWSLEQLQALQEEVDPPALPARTRPLTSRLNLEACQAALLEAYQKGDIKLKLGWLESLLDEAREEDLADE